MTAVQYVHISFEIWGFFFSLVAMICVYATQHINPKGAGWLAAILWSVALSDLSEAFAYYFRGNETSVGYVIVRVSNFLVFFLGYFLLFFFLQYMKNVLELHGGQINKWIYFAIVGICITGAVLLVLSRFFGFYYAFDSHNRYYRSDAYWIIHTLGITALFLLIVATIMNRKKLRRMERIAFFAFELCPILAMIYQILFYGISAANILNTFMALFIFVTYLRECMRYIVTREKEEANMKIMLYERQIQPHFIYNTLAAIRSHMPEDSEARDLLNHFIMFLRGNIDTLTETQCISAKQELRTVENYLYIERYRFEDQLRVIWDINDVEFVMPAFTVQLLVENAIRHGIRGKDDGSGTVTVRTYETKKEHVITVEDDGVGFDVTMLQKMNSKGADGEERAHVGLLNLINRLEIMCRGRMEIHSAPGKGTIIKVHIPK